MSKLIVGCGYLGLRVARLWRESQEEVFAVTRSAERAGQLAAAGIRPIVADVTMAGSLNSLPAVETVLYAVGYDRKSPPGMREVYVEGLRHALDALPNSVQRIVYVSSTSVYAQTDGGWVDEASECSPVLENGRICLEAEQTLNSSRWAARAIVLRLAGIYGPRRIPRSEALMAGEPIAAPAQGFLNLIHVDDAAGIVAAAARIEPPRLYTVSDGRPPQRGDYYAELARLLGAPAPRFINPPADSPAALRAESNKRVSNRRMLSDLRIQLQFPSYREGLAAIVAGG
jgi:nucleoside-diphosphate-sugar epimerase